MTTYTWPQTALYTPNEQKLLIIHNQIVTESILSKYKQVLSRPGAMWGWDILLSDMNPSELAEIEAFITRLSGQEHWVTMFDWIRPVPRGTINLGGVTMSSTAAQFATSAILAGCGNTKTLLAGDWLKLGSQLVMNVTDATSNAGGVMTIEFRHMLRAQVSAGASVVLDHPTSNYIAMDPKMEFARQAGYAQPGPAIRLAEIF
jgi:hypothetical protein